MHRFRKFPAIAALFLHLAGACAAQASVVIQEVLYDGPGTDPDDVFTELFGTPGTDLGGWRLIGVNGNDGSIYRTVDLGGLVLPADGILVIATEAASGPLAAARDFTANVDWQNGPDAIQLYHDGTLIDALQYGDAGVFNSGEGAYAPDITGGVSLSRNAYGSDTNDNASDFTSGAPTPGTGPAVVPLPAAAWLLGSGLGLLGMAGTRRKRLAGNGSRGATPARE